MLRFQTPPDKVFTAILKDSLELIIDEINDAIAFSKDTEEFIEQLNSLLPNASRVFNPKTTISTIKEMLACLEKPQLYYLNDYHYLLLYDTLSNLCDLHNDAVNDTETQEDRIEASQIGDYNIEELLFDEIVDIYFFDTDFLTDPDDMVNLGVEGRKNMAFNEETFAITQGLAPHPEELKLRVHKGEETTVIDISPYFGSQSKVYPDFD
ncbi:MAG: hypothetical protein JSW20_02135 [Nitrospiraceae bacterium]|nr:MAG: hypothetical protein JSW20_02135 [Nitrospiraceae bacterium]